jgi:hypothetical protein
VKAVASIATTAIDAAGIARIRPRLDPSPYGHTDLKEASISSTSPPLHTPGTRKTMITPKKTAIAASNQIFKIAILRAA